MGYHPRLIDVVGGNATMAEAATAVDRVRHIRNGLPIGAIDSMIDTGRLTRGEVDQVILPRKTLAHRRKLGTLTPEQSDRLMRVARIVALAEETFGVQDRAAKWLRRPTTTLDGERPLDLLDTDEGTREVEAVLGRISHGIAA